jgi:hypothetical protein
MISLVVFTDEQSERIMFDICTGDHVGFQNKTKGDI